MGRKVEVTLATAAVFILIMPTLSATASEFWYGCRSRPACGKVCQLVCETKEIKSICYACECDEICIPGKSKRGCKHCDTACCTNCGDDCAGADCCEGCDGAACGSCGHTPRCEFCWRDWVPCGCGRPRRIKVLTKYEAVKEICWYHWEVVDAASCGCADGCDGSCDASCGACACTGVDGKPAKSRCIYKPAPEDAEIGAVLAVSDEERVELASFMAGSKADVAQIAAAEPVEAAELAEPQGETVDAPKPSVFERMAAAVGLARR